MIDSQMKGISNLKIDKVIVWGNGEAGGKGGISHLLKDLITGLPPVTDLARAAGIELPPVLGRITQTAGTDPAPAAPAPTKPA
jgi:hypothetical protein